MLIQAILCSVLVAPAPTVPEALDWAHRFANGIQSDAKDRERSQEAVVLDIAMHGALDDAAKRADSIEGWRRGVAYAEIAKMMAKAGRASDAKSLLAKAATVSSPAQGWEGPRIESHIAQAQALIGGIDDASPSATRLEEQDELQYRGLNGVLRASAHTVRGELAAAMTQLDAAGQDTAIEIAWPLTQAYLDVARHPKARPADRRKALDAARESANRAKEVVSRLDALDMVAEGYRVAGFSDSAVQVLDEFHGLVVKLPDTTILKGTYLASEARTRAKLNDRAASMRSLADAEAIASQAYAIDRPAVVANVAAGYFVAGDAAKSAALLNDALTAAEKLVNARPRALAFVEIGRVLGRFDVPMTAPVRARFDAALRGLKDPW